MMIVVVGNKNSLTSVMLYVKFGIMRSVHEASYLDCLK